MLSNATILRIDTPTAADGAGDVAVTAGGTMAARCAAIPKRTVRPSTEIAEAFNEMTALVSFATFPLALAAGGYDGTLIPAKGQIWTVGIDGQAQTWVGTVQTVGSVSKGSLSHWQVLLRQA